MKASSSFGDEVKLDEFEAQDEEDEMALLSKKLQRILRENLALKEEPKQK